MKLWAWRVEEVRSASDLREVDAELGAFGWWFGSGAFDDEWAIDQLIEILPIGGKVDAHHEVMAKLAALPKTMALKAVTAARLLVEGDRDGWVVLTSKPAISTIIANAWSSSDGRDAVGASWACLALGATRSFGSC